MMIEGIHHVAQNRNNEKPLFQSKWIECQLPQVIRSSISNNNGFSSCIKSKNKTTQNKLVPH